MRVYNRWAGQEQGTREVVERCVVEVPNGGTSPLVHQCYRKRGKGRGGLLCTQHAKQDADPRRHLYIPEDV